MRIFIDTCVWRYWLTFKNGILFERADFEKHAMYFDQIYKIVLSDPLQHVFLYNARIEGELPVKYQNTLPISFFIIKESNAFEKIPIPLSRADGTYICDGSLLRGGRFGGTLRDILSMDGCDHETALHDAPSSQLRNPAHTKPRIKEFDVEHLESALEAEANLFITTDQPLIDRLNRALKLFPENTPVTRANEICVTPSQALDRLNI